MAGITVTLMTLPILFGPATSAMIIWAIGADHPPPIPWITWKAISEVLDAAMPQRAEPSEQDDRPDVDVLCPEFPRRPAGQGITAASESR